MTTDTQSVQSGQVSTPEPVPAQAPATQPVPAGAPPVTPPAPPPLTAEVVQKMVAEATAKVLQEAKEAGKRELQSAQDRHKAEIARADRLRRIAEGSLTAAQTRLTQVDPDAAKEMELAAYRERERNTTVLEQEESAARAQEEFHKQFTGSLTQFVTGLGLDPADKRIDWATDAPNYLDAQRRVLDSVSKIQKENTQTTIDGLKQQLKDLTDKINKVNVEANSVATTTSPGVVVGSDAEFVKKFADGTVPMTTENVKRYEKIKESYS